MKLGLINSAWVQAGQSVAFGLQKTKQIGFDTVLARSSSGIFRGGFARVGMGIVLS